MNAEPTDNDLLKRAAQILTLNDQGSYTVPTHGLYPFQWNWDSCLTALGQAHLDEGRAWLEIQTLFEHQWSDGMVPHIIFHKDDDGYFPGPSVWGTENRVAMKTPTSGITQPPVAGFAARKLFESANDVTIAKDGALSLLGKIDQWHQWFYSARDQANTGLVALLHPWESGRDNSIDWDDAFERVPNTGVPPYVRRDTQHANPDHRPTKAQYDRYLWLVEHFRSLGWDNTKLHDASPFQVVDPGFNAILIRSCQDLAWLADKLDQPAIRDANLERAKHGIAAMETLWSDEHSQYLCFDRAANKQIDNPSVGGLLPTMVTLAPERMNTLAKRIASIEESCNYLVPSQAPDHAEFDAKRYWRGPVWLIVNYMIADGLRQAKLSSLADNIDQASLNLIRKSGFAEYYDPITGEACGGGTFTWTAAMVMVIVSEANR